VAGEEELALLRERLRAPAPRSEADITSIRAELISRLDAPLKETWPATKANLVNYEIGFTPSETIVHVKYEADAPLDETAEEMMMNVLRSRLDVATLRVSLEHMKPPPAAAPKRRRN
jgi:hypothetical protein